VTLEPQAGGSAPAPRPVSVWNVANGVTAVRLLMVPLFTWLLLRDGGATGWWRLLAAAVFVVAAATDRLDGDLARSRGLITDVGKIADPVADKALVGAALVSLSVLGELPWWVTLVILTREIGITVMRFLVIRHGVMPAGRGGKAKTATQILAVTLYLVQLPGNWYLIGVAVMAVATFLTLASGLEYVVQAVRLVATSERTRQRRAERAARRGTSG
jgi:CDP-diacylglycerol---glycerol-3-phosphate 3-phosphatidyltransferase